MANNLPANESPKIIPPVTGEFPDSAKERERIFVLHFKHQNQIKQKNFNFRGPLKEAIERGKDHCNKMGYRFVLVRPFVVDLTHQEDLKFSDPERFEEGY